MRRSVESNDGDGSLEGSKGSCSNFSVFLRVVLLISDFSKPEEDAAFVEYEMLVTIVLAGGKSTNVEPWILVGLV